VYVYELFGFRKDTTEEQTSLESASEEILYALRMGRYKAMDSLAKEAMIIRGYEKDQALQLFIEKYSAKQVETSVDIDELVHEQSNLHQRLLYNEQ
jgi:hypothetical protein